MSEKDCVGVWRETQKEILKERVGEQLKGTERVREIEKETKRERDTHAH